MYTSASSSAYPSRRGVSSTAISTSRRDERLSSGPLTNERVMMEQIRSKLEKTQRRMARDRATATSQHGYNSTRGVPMSMGDMGIASGSSARHHHHEYPSSRQHSRGTHPTVSSSAQGTSGSTHYFPPDYRSGRAPAVQSVYLEDLPMTIHSNQRAAPHSRAPTSYAPGSGLHAPPPSNAPSYYAPSLDETTRAHRSTSRQMRSHHYEGAPVASQTHVRSERHAVHKLAHHHHHRVEQREKVSRHISHPQDPPHHPDRKHVVEKPRLRDERPPVPPPSTTTKRGILRRSSIPPPPPSASMPQFGSDVIPPSATFDSSNYLGYGSSHDSVPLSSTPHYLRQPLAARGQPERSVLKQQRRDIDPPATGSRTDNQIDESDAGDAGVVQPPPSSRVRFEDELLYGAAYPPLVEEDEDAEDSDIEPLEFLGEEMPYDPRDDEVEFDLDDVGEEEKEEKEKEDKGFFPTSESPKEPLEPVVAIKQADGVVNNRVRESSPQETEAVAASPRHLQKARANSDKDKAAEIAPRRRRGSSAARTPPNASPSASHARKSLTEPPKSAIDASMFSHFDMRERRASREKRLLNASEKYVSVDPLAVSLTADKPSEAAVDPKAKLSSSPIDIYGVEEYASDYGDAPPSPRHSKGSLHESDLDVDDDEVPSVPSRHCFGSFDLEKLSPSSTEEYSDARAYPEDDDENEDRTNTNAATDKDHGLTKTPGAQDAPLSTYTNVWEPTEAADSDDDDEVPPKAPPTLSKPPTKALSAATPTPVPQDESPPVSSPSSPDIAPARAASSIAAARVPPPRPQQAHRREHLNRRDLPRPPPSLQRPPSKPMPLSQSLMLMAPPSATRSGHRPPPMSTHIRPSPATARFSTSMSSSKGAPRAPLTADGALAASNYVPRRLRTKDPASQLRKAMPPSIGALSGLASGPVTFELNVHSFYEIVWHTGEFGFSFQRVYLEEVDANGAPTTRRLFLRMLLNTERGTCPSFKEVHVGDVLVEIGGTRVCDIKLDKSGGGAALTKLFTELRTQTPLPLVFQRMDPMTWEGGVEL